MTKQVTIITPELGNDEESTIAKMRDDASLVVVKSDIERANAIEFGKSIKAKVEQVKAMFADSKAKAHAAHKAITALESSIVKPLEAAISVTKTAILDYDRKQDAIREAAQRKAQAEAEEAARKERERLEKAAEKLKTPELREARLEEAAMVTPVVVDVAPTPKREGESTSVIWKARVVDVTLVDRAYMLPDQKALDSLAKATKGKLKLAGVEFYAEKNLALR